MQYAVESSRVTEHAYIAAIDFIRSVKEGLPNQGLSFIQSAITNACLSSLNPFTLKDHNEAAAYVAGIVERARYDFPEEESFRNFLGCAKSFSGRSKSFEAGRQFYSDHKASANAKSIKVLIDAYAKICESLGVEDELNIIKSGGVSLAHA